MKLINILILFMVGAIVGSFFDGFHTHSLTTQYPHPWKWQMAWWVPLLFGSASVTIGISHLWLDKKWAKPVNHLTWPIVLIGFMCFGMIYYASGFFKLAPFTKTLSLATASLIIWYFFDASRQGLIVAFGTAIIGCLVEIILIQLGLFRYIFPDFLGIPYWLPFPYIAASISVGNLARKLEN